MPFKNLHSCRLRRPGDFKADSFRTDERTHEGKSYRVIRGRLKSNDEWADQAFRYPTDNWSEREARKHCRDHDGILFEPASTDDDEASAELLPMLREAALASVWALSPRYMAALTRSLTDGRVDPLLTLHTAPQHQTDGAEMGAVAVVPLHGVLLYRSGYYSELYGGSTEVFVRRMRAAAANRDVAAILMDVNSPGGVVDGVPEAWQAVMEIRKHKPVVAIANTLMASAAYWIASAATEIVASPSAEVGSIGVFALHMEVSRMLDSQGVTVNLIRQPAGKAEVNPFEPLSDEARAYLQAQIDETYVDFIKQVAQGRRVKKDVVREQYGQGRTLMTDAALEAGLIDRVARLDELVTGLLEKYGSGRGNRAVAADDEQRLTLATDEQPTQCTACAGTGLDRVDPQRPCESCEGSGKERIVDAPPDQVPESTPQATSTDDEAAVVESTEAAVRADRDQLSLAAASTD